MQWWIKICILTYFFRLASWANGGNIGGSRRQCAHPIKQTTKQDYNLARFPCWWLYTSTNRQQIGPNLFLQQDQMLQERIQCLSECSNKWQRRNTYIHGGVKKYKFEETHPGHKFSHLIQLKFPCIPRVALPKGKLCPLNKLDLKCTNPPQHVVGKREMYAKIALLMFYPFQKLNDLKCW